ncbi:uncharacterized protein [Leptinotarsa decemlineata]|uniref:uncharacterized protein n=1 Tax=Leptinotarsa decemlineata TaxID=7539 RepID=UPI003D30D321
MVTVLRCQNVLTQQVMNRQQIRYIPFLLHLSNQTINCTTIDRQLSVHTEINFLQDENKRKQWMDAVRKYLPDGAFICSKHFTIHFIGEKKLLKGAKPSCISQLDYPVEKLPLKHEKLKYLSPYI